MHPCFRWMGITQRLSYEGPHYWPPVQKRLAVRCAAACGLRYCLPYCKSAVYSRRISGGGCSCQWAGLQSEAAITQSGEGFLYKAEQVKCLSLGCIMGSNTYTNYSRVHRNAIESSAVGAFSQMSGLFPPLQSIKRLICLLVLLQLTCSFIAAFAAFPLQTRSGCSWGLTGVTGKWAQ